MKGGKTVWKPAHTIVTSHATRMRDASSFLSLNQDAAAAWLVEAKAHERGRWSPVPSPQSSYTTVFHFLPQPLLQCHLPSLPSRILKQKAAEGNALLCQATAINDLQMLHKAGVDGWAAVEFLCRRVSSGDGWSDSYLIAFPMGWKSQYKCEIYNQWGTTYGASKESYNSALSDFL